MARTPPDDDARVTDLNRYRKAKAAEARRPPPKSKPPRESFLGSNPRAGLILAIAAAIVFVLYVVPMFLR